MHYDACDVHIAEVAYLLSQENPGKEIIAAPRNDEKPCALCPNSRIWNVAISPFHGEFVPIYDGITSACAIPLGMRSHNLCGGCRCICHSQSWDARIGVISFRETHPWATGGE